MDKNDLRKAMTARRLKVTRAAALRANERIAARAAEYVKQHSPRAVHVYTPLTSLGEIDTMLIGQLLKQQHQACKVVYGEPNKIASLPTDVYEVIVVPLLAFDKRLQRVGYGGGWYDRFLASQPQAVAIGLAYDFQEVESVASGSHDVALDAVVTPTRLALRP